MKYVILAALALAAICFSIRFYALKHSIREACRELEEIRKEPDQDRILHISVPDRSMEKLLQSMNLTLKEIRSEGAAVQKERKAVSGADRKYQPRSADSADGYPWLSEAAEGKGRNGI